MTYCDMLKSKKIKVTFARKVILDIVGQADEAVSAEYIFEKCMECGYNINLSTVYRTMETFENKGLIEKFDLGDGRYSYSIKCENHKHVIECTLCHQKIEVDCPMKMLEEIIKNKTGFTMMEHEFHIKGICKQCKDKL